MGAQQDLFGSEPEPGRRADAPLASRLRPLSFDDLVGQEKTVAVLRSLAESGRLPSIVLWGPPGSGKTTLAAILARATGSRFVAISAVTSGVPELRKDELRKLAAVGALNFIQGKSFKFQVSSFKSSGFG